MVYLGLDFWKIFDSKAVNVNSENWKVGICGTYEDFLRANHERITLMLRVSNRPKPGLNFLRHPTQHRQQQQQPRAVHRTHLVEHVIFIESGFDRCHDSGLDNCFPTWNHSLIYHPIIQPNPTQLWTFSMMFPSGSVTCHQSTKTTGRCRLERHRDNMDSDSRPWSPR